MRAQPATLLALAYLASIVGCGGDVVVDSTSEGGGGSSSTSSTGTGGADGACGDLSGEEFTTGGCQAYATCSGNAVLVDCEPANGAASCVCEVQGTVVGTCQEASLHTPDLCSPIMGCCSMYFTG